jgi:hypothetical protein
MEADEVSPEVGEEVVVVVAVDTVDPTAAGAGDGTADGATTADGNWG